MKNILRSPKLSLPKNSNKYLHLFCQETIRVKVSPDIKYTDDYIPLFISEIKKTNKGKVLSEEELRKMLNDEIEYVLKKSLLNKEYIVIRHTTEPWIYEYESIYTLRNSNDQIRIMFNISIIDTEIFITKT